MAMSKQRWDDADFASDAVSARIQGPRPATGILLFVVLGFFVIGIFWAYNAKLDEVTRGQGRVIPSSQNQVVQSLEGGIVKAILIDEGQIVDTGEKLLGLDPTGFQASYGEQLVKYYSLMAEIARLTAEVEDKPLEFPPDLLAERPEIAVRETDLFEARKAELQSQLAILRDQEGQRRQEVAEMRGKMRQLQDSLKLVDEEMALTEPLVASGVVPKINLIRLKRELTETRGELNANRLAMPRAQAAMSEASRRIEEKAQAFRSAALQEINQKKAEFSQVEESIRAARDRVVRTEIRSPVKGIVKTLHVRTVGGVVRPGEDLVEIVPLEDTLLVEAQIRPADVAFLRPGQKATVKFTAYDFSIYGGLAGEVVRISADTITDDQGDSFYKIILRTDKNHLTRAGEVLPIIPGMVTSVDILTGQKTVLEYLLKPLRKAGEYAMTER